MAVKKCCIKNCKSCSTRKEDVGVTYHKFPRDVVLRDSWITITRHKHTNIDTPQYVCSRHFCKTDFQIFKDSKYMLKSDAVPSIFNWSITRQTRSGSKMEVQNADELSNDDSKDVSLNSSKESEPENLDAIKKFIEDQEKEISEQKSKESSYTEYIKSNEDVDKDVNSVVVRMDVQEDGSNVLTNDNDPTIDVNELKYGANLINSNEDDFNVETNRDAYAEAPIKHENAVHKEDMDKMDIPDESLNVTLSVASGVLDMILSETEVTISKKKDEKSQNKKNLNPVDKGNSSVSLSVGSKVEAKDFGESWHPAQIVEVDYDEMEVLVHYQDLSKKHDEWISVSSPRLRPLNSPPEQKEIQEKRDKPEPIPTPSTSVAPPTIQVDDEAKSEQKPRLMFVVGERCLARWKDNRRFTATVTNVLGKGSYEVMFDDGFNWKCTSSRLYKLKKDQASKVTTSSCIPQGPTNAPLPSPIPLGPAFDTHLFDPTRDHLGSKSERREMKRKLNIKEIFNIGMKKRKKLPDTQPVKVEKKLRRRKTKEKVDIKTGVKTEVKKVQESVASIIGTMSKSEHVEKSETLKDILQEVKEEFDNDAQDDPNSVAKDSTGFTSDSDDASNDKIDYDPVEKEEVKLERFEPDEVKHAEVIDIIDRIKEEISKLEESSYKEKTEKIDSPQLNTFVKPEITEVEKIIKDEILDIPTPVEVIEAKGNATENSPAEFKEEVNETKETLTTETVNVIEKKVIIKIKGPEKPASKVKKGKKLKLLQEKKVKKEVKKVRSELLEMRKQMEEMKKQIFLKTEQLMKNPQSSEMPESFLLPGEWCCKWVNGQPVGQVSEIESEIKVNANNKPGLPRRSVQVEDKRLPPEWTKHMVRRSFGNSAGKWDVVLVSPDNRRFHTKSDMRNYLETYPDDSLKPYEHALLDFGAHQKLSRRMGWVSETPGGEVDNPVTVGVLSFTSPLLKTRKLSLKKRSGVEGKRRSLSLKKRLKPKKKMPFDSMPRINQSLNDTALDISLSSAESSFDNSTLEDGYVYVGSLKVQVIDTLLRCPAEGCFKNFRNNTLLQMHIKHYHRELRKLMGVTPKVLDLAYARTKAEETEIHRQRTDNHQNQIIKVKLPKSKRLEEIKPETSKIEIEETSIPPMKPEHKFGEKIPRSQDSPKLRKALSLKLKRPKVLLPVRRVEEQEDIPDFLQEDADFEPENVPVKPIIDVPEIEALDFETAISTHTVTKPEKKKRSEKRVFAVLPKTATSEDDEWCNVNSDVETMSSFPRSGTPDSKTMDSKSEKAIEFTEEQKEDTYTYENGERIKIVHMKREEIINCHCGFREEDGLMVQCELCLCWQHGLCHNIHKESDVPEKYTCSICLNPKRGRRSQRFLHDQDRLYEGLLPGAKPCESLRRSHELSGNLLRIEDALHALRVKYYVATKKCHPKLYLWAKDWENGEINMTIEKLNSDYSDLNIMINNVGKENLPMRAEEMRDLPLTIDDQDNERLSQKDDQLGSQTLLSGLLSSPGESSLDLQISTSELEKLAKSVQDQEVRAVSGPQPEAPIENSACRERLLRHVQRCQALIDARLDSIEAQVAELESQDPSFEDDETADYFPRTKQTIQMLMRDLDTMEELGILT